MQHCVIYNNSADAEAALCHAYLKWQIRETPIVRCALRVNDADVKRDQSPAPSASELRREVLDVVQELQGRPGVLVHVRGERVVGFHALVKLFVDKGWTLC